jgi:hypothetical protein
MLKVPNSHCKTMVLTQNFTTVVIDLAVEGVF